MALSPIALFDNPDDVWDSLCVQEDDRLVKDTVMERWINMASGFMEQLLDRPVVPRDITDELDGNSRPIIYVRNTPALSLLSLRVYDSDFRNFDDIEVDQTPDGNREVSFVPPGGRLILLPDAPIARFTKGVNNVHVTYRAGFEPEDLAVIQEAAIEMIAIRYNEIGRHPLEQNRSDAINTISTFNKADFDELPWLMQQTVMTYRLRRV